MASGNYVRQQREELQKSDRRYSVRQGAAHIGVQPAYLSKVEREEISPPGEDTKRRLAETLGEEQDVPLAMDEVVV